MELAYVTGSVATYPAGATFGPRLLRDYELVWIIEGDVVYHADGADYVSPPGTMLIARPGFRDAFTWDERRETRHAFIHCHFTSMPPEWPAPAEWPVLVNLPENDIVRPLFRYVLSMCMWARQERQGPPPKPSSQLSRAVETLLGALLLGPLGQFDELGRDLPEPVRRAMRFMDEKLGSDPGSKVTLSDLAKASAVSAEHLCRLFVTSLNVTPMDAMRYQRLDLAMGLVARSNLNMEQIAYRCGFASPYHFSRVFKQVYGLAPTPMRKRIEAGFPPPLTPLVRVLRK